MACLSLLDEIARRGSRVITWRVPVKLRNPLNSRQHWRKVAGRAIEEKELTILNAPSDIAWRLPVVVIVTRDYHGRSQPFDAHDALPAACKHIVDGVCEVIGVDDADERVQPRYAQVRVVGSAEAGVVVSVVQGARVVESLVFDEQ